MTYQAFAALSGVLFLLLAVLQIFQLKDKIRLHREIARKSALISVLYKRIRELEKRKIKGRQKEAVK